MSGLFLRNESSGRRWRVWPDAVTIPEGQIRETGSDLFELEGDEKDRDAALHVDGMALEALRASDQNVARWRWSLGFHAGTIEAELRLPGQQPKRFEIITDPDQRKLTRDDFDAMVREILEDTFALFSLSAFRRGLASGVGNRPPPIARLEFLRSRINELEEIVLAIARAPRRRLASDDVRLPYHRAIRATGPEIIRSLRSGRQLRESGAGPSRLPEALRGYLPEQIQVRQRRGTLDLIEHRQMAACLQSWVGWLAGTAALLELHMSGDDAELRDTRSLWAGRCRRLARQVDALALLPPFAEAGEASPHLTPSSIFRRDPAYRRFFRLWRDISLGIAAVFGDFLNMPLARTFELYELWCFLRLVRAGAEVWGTDSLAISDLFVTAASGSVTLAAGAVTVPVGDGWKLCFQKKYQEFWTEPDRRGSFTRVMVPDVVVARDGAAPAEVTGQLIVLDAKYRVETGLNDALSSIHAYRDALVSEIHGGGLSRIVSAAYLLAPYLPAATHADYQKTPMPGRLFHPEFRQAFRFGALTLRPGMTVAAVGEALKAIVADATSYPGPP